MYGYDEDEYTRRAREHDEQEEEWRRRNPDAWMNRQIRQLVRYNYLVHVQGFHECSTWSGVCVQEMLCEHRGKCPRSSLTWVNDQRVKAGKEPFPVTPEEQAAAQAALKVEAAVQRAEIARRNKAAEARMAGRRILEDRYWEYVQSTWDSQGVVINHRCKAHSLKACTVCSIGYDDWRFGFAPTVEQLAALESVPATTEQLIAESTARQEASMPALPTVQPEFQDVADWLEAARSTDAD
jgi:hypothetical protein